MKILVDADFILEVFLNRNQFREEAEKVWNYFYSEQANGYISEMALEKIYRYIQELGNVDIADETIWVVTSVFQILPINSKILQEAASMKYQDFESAIEVVCAKKNNIDAILTQKNQDFQDIDYNIWSFEDLLQRRALEKKYNDQYDIERGDASENVNQINYKVKFNFAEKSDSEQSSIENSSNRYKLQQKYSELDTSTRKQNQHKFNINFLTRFLLFCAGAKTHHIVKPECEKDRSKYASIGATIFITAVMAGLSGGYALFTVFQSYAVAAGLGTFWGVTIFNLDRSFTSTTKKTQDNSNWFKKTIATGIRLSLATLVGLVIAKPFEVKVFESKINETIARETILEDKATRNSTAEAERITDLKAEVKELEDKERRKQDEWLYWEDLANKEAEGTQGTGLRGKGIVYTEKKETATKLKQQVEDLRQKISRKEETITQLENQQDDIIKVIKENTKISFVDQLETLHKLTKEEEIIALSSWGISLLLVAIEISPLLVKILSPYGVYDSLIEAEEENVITIQNQQKKLINQLVKKFIRSEIESRNAMREKTTHFIDSQYTKLLKESFDHKSIENAREKMIFVVAQIVEDQLIDRAKDINSLEIEINKNIAGIIKAETVNQYQDSMNYTRLETQMNQSITKFDNLINEIKYLKSNNNSDNDNTSS